MRPIGVVTAAVLAVSCARAPEIRLQPYRPAPGEPPADQPAASTDTAAPVGALPPGSYDLSALPVFKKVLHFVRENYFDKTRFDYKQMALSALHFVELEVPEILVEPSASPAEQVTVTVSQARRTFSLAKLEAPWNLVTVMGDIFRFIQPNLLPLAADQEGRRLLDLERAAANGLLYTLDPHSVLLRSDEYRDMRAPAPSSPPGSVGLTLAMDAQDRIVVRRPLPASPAAQAGIKAGDRIVRIDDEGTQTMTLVEAVEWLRGPLGSKVDLYVERDGHPGVTKHTAIRATVNLTSIDPPPEILTRPSPSAGADRGGAVAGKVGYLHLQHFGRGAAREVGEALVTFERAGVKGIILDLRDNVGGLYQEAYKVADAFVETGILVSMVGTGKGMRKDETASETGSKPKVPVIVIVNPVTASGSEIVAAALKNLDRAVVIGEPTFGMGSVQVLFDIPSPLRNASREDADPLGLKLTTAQFLAPGDVTLQGVGIVPDIQTQAMVVRGRGASALVHLQASAHERRETDYERHLPTMGTVSGQKPAELLPYLIEGGGGAEYDSRTEGDFLTSLARDLLLQAKGTRRPELLSESKPLLSAARAAEDRKVGAALRRLGIDWAAGSSGGPAPVLQLSISPVGTDKAAAGHVATIRGLVKNVGPTAAFRVRAVLESADPTFDGRELVFGKIGPGDSKTYDLSLDVPTRELTQTELLRARLFTEQGVAQTNVAETTLAIQGRTRSSLAYRYRVLPAVGHKEPARVQVMVTNRGSDPIERLQATLRGPPGRTELHVQPSRFEEAAFAAGATKTFTFPLAVRADSQTVSGDLTLALGDPTLTDWVTDKVKVSLPAADDATEFHEVKPPILTVSAPAVAQAASVHVRARVVASNPMRDAYISVWNRNQRSPAKKAFYRSNPNLSSGDRTTMDFEADVPISPGRNFIDVSARDGKNVRSHQVVVVLER